MFGLSKFLEFTIYILQRSFYVEFASEYYANNKPDVKIFGKQFSGYNKLDFKFTIYIAEKFLCGICFRILCQQQNQM